MKNLSEVLIESLTNEAISVKDKAGIKMELSDILFAGGSEKNLEKLDRYMDILGIAINGAYWRLANSRYKARYEYVKDVDGGVDNGGTTDVYIFQTNRTGNVLAVPISDYIDEKWIKKLEDALSLKPGKTTKNYIYYYVNPYQLD